MSERRMQTEMRIADAVQRAHRAETALELSRNLYDELFSQTKQLRAERQQAIDALREPAKEKCCYDGMDCPDSWPTMPLYWCVPCFARAALVKLGEKP